MWGFWDACIGHIHIFWIFFVIIMYELIWLTQYVAHVLGDVGLFSLVFCQFEKNEEEKASYSKDIQKI